MAEVKLEVQYSLELSKREYTLVTKALCGTLRGEELEEAKELGLGLMKDGVDQLTAKQGAATHALGKANEEP